MLAKLLLLEMEFLGEKHSVPVHTLHYAPPTPKTSSYDRINVTSFSSTAAPGSNIRNSGTFCSYLATYSAQFNLFSDSLEEQCVHWWSWTQLSLPGSRLELHDSPPSAIRFSRYTVKYRSTNSTKSTNLFCSSSCREPRSDTCVQLYQWTHCTIRPVVIQRLQPLSQQTDVLTSLTPWVCFMSAREFATC
jgi:hypothetical protein